MGADSGMVHGSKTQGSNMTTKNDDNDLSKWATWALLNEAFNSDSDRFNESQRQCVRRLQQLAGSNPDFPVKPGPRMFVIITSGGHWGRGQTLGEAAKTTRKAGAARSEIAVGILVLNDATPEINGGGGLITESIAETYQLGRLGTLGSILNANK